MIYTVSNPSNTIVKLIEGKEQAEKAAAHLSIVFNEQFTVEKYIDVWAISFDK